MPLLNWLAEFRDPAREARYLARERSSGLLGLRIGLAVVLLGIVLATWADCRLFGNHQSATRQMLLARGCQVLGVALASVTWLGRRFQFPVGISMNAGAILISLGHVLGTRAILLGSGHPPNALWSTLFIVLALTTFILPLRYALPAALWFVLGEFVIHTFVVATSARELYLSVISTVLALGLGTVACYRLNRGRRHEFAILESEQGTNALLHEEVQAQSRATGQLQLHASNLEEKLFAAQRLEAIGRVAGGVAHDLNNLLTPVIGYAEMALGAAKGQAELEGLLGEVLEAGNRAKALLSQLLAAGRRQHLHLGHLELSSFLLAERKTLCAIVGTRAHITIETNHEPCTVLADEVQLLRVLTNLVVNASDAMHKPGHIRMTLERRVPSDDEACALELVFGTEYAVLVVSDDGAGMSPDVQKHLFEPLFTTKTPGKGTGLGLFTVHGIVKQHRGAIQVESIPQMGTSFEIWLPLDQSEGEGATVAPATPRSARGGSEAVLVLEEDPVVRSMIERILRQAGYDVTGVATEAAADAALRTGHPVRLLIYGGERTTAEQMEFVHATLRSVASLRVLFIATYACEHPPKVGLGPTLPKPFTRTELLSFVRRTLDAPQKA